MYHAEVGFNQLKCDATVLLNTQDNRNAILLMNFNIPSSLLDENQTAPLNTTLEEIVQFISKKF